MTENIAYVYTYIDPVKRRVIYVGKGSGNRDAYHLKSLNRKCYDKVPFYRYLRKMIREGIQPIITRILDNVSDVEAYAFERTLIAVFGRVVLRTGLLMNVANGGEGGTLGLKLSADARANMSAAHKGKKKSAEHCMNLSKAGKSHMASIETRAKLSVACSGWKHSAEARAKIGAASKGRKFSDETRARMSAAHKGKKFSLEHRAKIGAKGKGRKHSVETKAKISAANKRRKTDR